jgi:indolepyruvate ferredoxin oxidoreductase
MVYDPAVPYPDDAAMLADVRANSRVTYPLDTIGAAEALFGSTEVANLIVVGAAFQAGLLPLTADSIERAIDQNGVAVAANRAAFEWGRVAIADPAAFAAAVSPPASAIPAAPNGDAFVANRALEGETLRLAGIRAAGMRDHSGKSAARRYVDLVELAWRAEMAIGDQHEFSEAVARGAHRLGAYKDEYEVARLLTDRALEAQALAAVPGAKGLTYHLHPPALRSAGMRNKLKLGRSMRPVLKLLAHGRRLRGTPLDLFGLARMRRIERALVADYTRTITAVAATLDRSSFRRAVDIADATELVRGYEGVKLASLHRYQERRQELGQPLPADLLRLLEED